MTKRLVCSGATSLAILALITVAHVAVGLCAVKLLAPKLNEVASAGALGTIIALAVATAILMSAFTLLLIAVDIYLKVVAVWCRA